MRDNLTALPVREVMTRNPRATTPDVLLGEALEMINSARITALFVVDADKIPVGIVHVHDLLKMGAA
jgi:arabinose-5-phosphate isomerase